MAQFWKLDAATWINPAYIVQVKDYSTVDRSYVYVRLGSGSSGERLSGGAEEWELSLEGEASKTLLAYLARETESPPPPPPA